MIKEAIGTGATIDEAREAALLELGAGEHEDVQFEVISLPEKKKLGLFGGKLAQVRAYVELPDPKPAKKADKPREKKTEPKNEAKKQAPKPATPAEELPAEEEPVGVPFEQLDQNSQAARAVKYLNTVLAGLGCEGLTYTVAEIEDGAKVTIAGDESGVVIGHRGETLDALQYLCSLAASEKGKGYYRVVLNIGNYRQKRESTLAGVAKKTAAQVLRTGRSRTLEPMNPYERRIIHTTIQTIEGVTSASIGGGSARRVVVSPEGGERPREDRGHGRGGHGRGERRPAYVPTSEKAEKTVDQAEAPLFGRIR